MSAWAVSSVGRAHRWQRWGRWFESSTVHQQNISSQSWFFVGGVFSFKLELFLNKVMNEFSLARPWRGVGRECARSRFCGRGGLFLSLALPSLRTKVGGTPELIVFQKCNNIK